MRITFHTKKILKWVNDLPVGGAWGRTLFGQAQNNLRWLWFDSMFASASDNIILNFISLYILALGGTEVQVGLMSSLSSFLSALMLIFGAIIAEKIGRHKEVAVFAGGICGRLALLLLVFVPMFFKGASVVWVAILLAVVRDGCGNLGYPAWVSVINDTVPIEGRGRYFGARNFVMNISGMTATLLAGKLITLFTAHIGYQIALGLAFSLGVSSTYCFSKIKTLPKIKQAISRTSISVKSALTLFKGQPQFVALVAVSGFWNFAVNIPGPFFNVYMVKELGFSASTVGLLAVVTSLTGFIVLNRLGTSSDRLGPRKLQIGSMFLIPLLPLLWIFVKEPWHVALVNAAGGIMWAAFNLTSFNLMLNSIPKNQVPRYSALYQIMVTLSLALGALLGSALITSLGFITLLILSTVTRLMGAVLFAWLVHEPARDSLPD